MKVFICLDVATDMFHKTSLCNESPKKNQFTRDEPTVTCPYCKYAINRRDQRKVTVAHFPYCQTEREGDGIRSLGIPVNR